jgi:hypothetical protein
MHIAPPGPEAEEVILNRVDLEFLELMIRGLAILGAARRRRILGPDSKHVRPLLPESMGETERSVLRQNMVFLVRRAFFVEDCLPHGNHRYRVKPAVFEPGVEAPGSYGDKFFPPDLKNFREDINVSQLCFHNSCLEKLFINIPLLSLLEKGADTP